MPGRGVVKGETLVELLGEELPVIVLAVRLEVEVAVEGSCFTEERGPIKERMTGKRTRPWKRPKVTVRRKTCHEVGQVVKHNKNDDGNQVTLKKVMKT